MKKAVFETTLLPDGHLDCPREYVHRKDAHFKVVVTFEEPRAGAATDRDRELAAIHDLSDDFLSEEELSYYLALKES